MHIVLVCREYVGSSRSGGIGSYMEEIAKAYVAKGHNVTVVTASDDTRQYQEWFSKDNIHIISLSGGDFLVEKEEGSSKIKKLRCIYRFHSYRKKLRKVLLSLTDVDIIEVADYGAEALYLLDIGIPVVIRLHTPQSLSIADFSTVNPRWWQLHRSIPLRAEKTIFERARYISCCSNAILQWVQTHFDISQAKTSVIFNPVDISNLHSYVSEYSSDEKIVFYAGTISETKGLNELISACHKLIQDGHKLRLRIAGKGGTFQENLEKRIVENRWSWIEILGKLPRELVYKNYATADVCCFPSWWENMPMVCIESMAIGAVVVSTYAGGTSEIITDSYDGFLCERKNSRQLSEVLLKALSLNPEERAAISNNARKTIRSKFSTDMISNRMLDFFETVCNDFNEDIENSGHLTL